MLLSTKSAKSNKNVLTKVLTRHIIVSIATKHKTTAQGENMITREDLANKKIDKLENIEQAKEMINVLTYDECLAALNGTKNIPHELYSALIARAKEANNGKTTLALIIAGLQNISN